MKKYIILLSLFATLVSCEDQLDRKPVDVLISSTAFENIDDIEAGVNGIYTNLNLNDARFANIATDIIDINDIFTDNSKLGNNNGGQKLDVINQVLNTGAISAGIWNSRYGTANDCNRIIRAAEGIEVAESEQERFDNLLAQAYGWRAYAHYDLLLYYGEDFTNPGALGVPYQDKVENTGNPTRLTTQETITRIQEDLDTASSLLSDDFTDKFSVTQDFITFLRARIALITEQNPGAVITLTDGLINKYPLADQQQYQDMFAGDADQTEVIYAYDNVNGFNLSLAGEFIFTGTGGNFIGMSNGLFDALAAANDVRFAVNFDPESDLGSGEITINKYPSGGGTFINDFKLMRISEAYLMRAEAFARQGSFLQAAEATQAVKNARAGSNASATAYANLNEALTDIKLERRLELCFEGHRYIDIKRFRDDLNEGLVRDPRDCEGSIPCDISVSSRKWIFPIPQSETNANPVIQQNPQWDN